MNSTIQWQERLQNNSTNQMRTLTQKRKELKTKKQNQESP